MLSRTAIQVVVARCAVRAVGDFSSVFRRPDLQGELRCVLGRLRGKSVSNKDVQGAITRAREMADHARAERRADTTNAVPLSAAAAAADLVAHAGNLATLAPESWKWADGTVQRVTMVVNQDEQRWREMQRDMAVLEASSDPSLAYLDHERCLQPVRVVRRSGGPPSRVLPTCEFDHVPGRSFESHVGVLLHALQGLNQREVAVTHQREFLLPSGVKDLVDYELKYRLPFQVDCRLIECQDRARETRDIDRKVRVLKQLTNRNRFLFVYNKGSNKALRRSLDSDGVPYYQFFDFAIFLGMISRTLAKLRGDKLSMKDYARAIIEHDDSARNCSLRLLHSVGTFLCDANGGDSELLESLSSALQGRDPDEIAAAMLRVEAW